MNLLKQSGQYWNHPDSTETITPLFKLFLEPRNPHLPALGFWMYLYRTGHISIFGQICWGKSRFLHFLRFFTYLHSALPNISVFACFRPVFAIKNDHQHHREWIWANSYLYIICFFCTFCRFWPFLCIFCIFGVSVGVGGVLGVLLSYKITRGVKLVVGRVNNWV